MNYCVKPRQTCSVNVILLYGVQQKSIPVKLFDNLPTSVSFTVLPAFRRTSRSVDFGNFLQCNSC